MGIHVGGRTSDIAFTYFSAYLASRAMSHDGAMDLSAGGSKLSSGGAHPRPAASAYGIFASMCRDEQRKYQVSDQLNLTELNHKIGEKWKSMNVAEKQRFVDLSFKDKQRYELEAEAWVAAQQNQPAKKKKIKRPKQKKDPNLPKRALSAYILFCGEHRAQVKEEMPTLSMLETSKELGRRWKECTDRTRFEQLAAKEKERFATQMQEYYSNKVAGANAPPQKKPRVEAPAATATSGVVVIDADADDEDDDGADFV